MKRNRNYVFLLFSFVLATLFSCSERNTDNSAVIKTLDEGLHNSNIKIDSETNSLYRIIETKLLDQKFSPQANRWEPVAYKIQLLSDDLYNYIDSLKNDLKQQANFFKSKKKGIELYDRLRNYKQNLLELNPEINSRFRNKFLLTSKSFDFRIDNKKDFNETFLNNTSAEFVLALLTKFQNNIRIIENDMVSFCYSKIENTESDYNNYTLLISQSRNEVSPGQNIQLLVGVGIFSKASKPKINIDGRAISLGDNGAADYTFKASAQTGIHIVPIKVEYVNLEGITKSFSDTVKYNVSKKHD